MKRWLIFLVMAGVVGIGVILMMSKNKEMSLLNPLAWSENLAERNHKFTVLGFLPTWMIGKTKIYGSELDQLIFSGIEVKTDGSLVWDIQSKKINNDDYLEIKNNVKKNGGSNLISIKLFVDKDLDALVASEAARRNLYTEVKNLVEVGKFEGVNVDFEYMSDPTRILDEDMGEMFEEMKEAGWGEVSVDVFANTIIKGDIDRLKKFGQRVDKIIVMAYDFHRPGSEMAGAVAPMSAEVGSRSVNEIVRKIIDGDLLKEKFIMAYPLYGYEWETETNLMDSLTREAGYGRTVFYKEGVGFTGVVWDELAQSSWVAWQEKAQRSRVVSKKVGKKIKKVTEYFYVDQWHQAYFENERSLRIKSDVVRQNQLGGMGFWALGYEGASSGLIEDLKDSLSTE